MTLEMKGIDIHFVSARALHKLCQEPGNITFRISMNKLTSKDGDATKSIPVCRVDKAPEANLEPILEEYWEFMDIFSGEKANTLAPHQPHRPYNLQIKLEEGAKPVHGPIYSLSPLELTALQEFLEENTCNRFICPSKSLWGSLVLFVKKKDGSL